MSLDYERMLDEAYKALPPSVFKRERFEVPKPLVTISGSRTILHIFQGRFETETFERLIKRYVNEYVICPICKRPDTKIVKEKRLYFLQCEACGARSPLRPI